MDTASNVRNYFTFNVPKSLPDHVRLVLETAFMVDEYDISYSENDSIGGGLDIVWKLYALLRDFALSKSFDYSNYGAKLQVISRIFFLGLIKAVGLTYSEL